MPLILSQERTVGIETSVIPEAHKGCNPDSCEYLKSLETAPRLPILGTVPDHWKEGEVIPIGEYEVKDIEQPRELYSNGSHKGIRSWIEMIVPIPLTTK